jgi:hypothetical protein
VLHFARYTCVLALSALAVYAQGTTPTPTPTTTLKTTGMIGIAVGQTAQLNLLNPGVVPSATAAGVICSAVVTFIDAGGNILKSATVTVPPGQSSPYDLHSDTDLNLAAGTRRDIRALIMIPAVPPPSGATAATPACQLIPTLEIFDNVTGRTLVALGHADTIQ